VNSVFYPHYDAIADGLAENGYACVDNFLSDAEVTAILSADEFQSGLLQFHRAGTGQDKQIAEGVRGDFIRWIDRADASAPLTVFLERMSDLVSYLNRALFLSLKDFEVHTTIYPVGSFYKRHLDQFKKADHRKLSVICYLNAGWTTENGGELRVYLPDGTKDFSPVSGRLICFRSDLLEHEVLPATRERLSITGWMLDHIAELHL